MLIVKSLLYMSTGNFPTSWFIVKKVVGSCRLLVVKTYVVFRNNHFPIREKHKYKQQILNLQSWLCAYSLVYAAILNFLVFSSSNILILWATLQFSDQSPRTYNVKLYNSLLKRYFTFLSTELTLFSSIINTFSYLLN